MYNDLFNKIISITDLRRNFGRIAQILPRVESLIITKGGEPFAILKVVPKEKNKLLFKAKGLWKNTQLDDDRLINEIYKRKSRSNNIKI